MPAIGSVQSISNQGHVLGNSMGTSLGAEIFDDKCAAIVDFLTEIQTNIIVFIVSTIHQSNPSFSSLIIYLVYYEPGAKDAEMTSRKTAMPVSSRHMDKVYFLQ